MPARVMQNVMRRMRRGFAEFHGRDLFERSIRLNGNGVDCAIGRKSNSKPPLDGVRLFITDKCLGLVESLADFYPAAKWPMAHLINSTKFFNPHFLMALLRWALTVLMLTFKAAATAFVSPFSI